MRRDVLKYYIGICIIIFIDALHMLMFSNNDQFDVYVFYSHERYLTNILYDISNLFKFSILTHWLIKVNKKVFAPLFITSLFIWVFYFLFYNQEVSALIIPIYVFIVYLYKIKK